MPTAAEASRILAERNALRRGASLPLLDEHAELAGELRRARQSEYRQVWESQLEVLERFRKEALLALQAENGPTFGLGCFGRMMVNDRAQKLYVAHLAAMGHAPPD